jgi:hypothetical protein
MIARFDHRPMLTALLALTTTLLVVVVVTLATLLYTTSAPVASASSDSGGGNPGAAAAPANMDAGGENYGHDVVLPKPAQIGDSQTSDSAQRQEVGHP